MNILHIGCHNGKDHVLDFCKKNKDNINQITLVDANIEVLKQAKDVYLENFDKEKIKIYNLAVLPINLEGLEIPIYQPQGEKDSTIASVRADFVSLHCHTEIDKTHSDGIVNMGKRLEALIYYLDSIGFNCSTDGTQYNMKAIKR